MARVNPGLARPITETIGDEWVRDLEALRRLEADVDDPGFSERFLAVKRANEERLAEVVETTSDVSVDPDSLFDVQVKRIHEYKRQLLAALHVIHLYLEIVNDGRAPPAPRTCLFAGKTAPNYETAKLVIRLINEVGRVVNADPRTEGLLRVVFLPDYGVSLAERIIPGADLSEQSSTARHEASGTGNMKLGLNGAPTIGTFDGANIEICEAVGDENVYIFGLRAEEIQDLQARGADRPRELYESRPELRRVLDALRDGRFSSNGPDLFRSLFDSLVEHGDRYFHLADFAPYAETERRVAGDFADRGPWARRAALNVARIGRFSSDRAVREYAEEVWRLTSVH